MIDWQKIVETFGPTIAIVVVLMKAHHDLVRKTIPEGIAAIRRELRRARRAQEGMAAQIIDMKVERGRVKTVVNQPIQGKLRSRGRRPREGK